MKKLFANLKIFFLSYLFFSSANAKKKCNSALGMESRKIRDDQIVTSSDFYVYNSTGARFTRARDKAWCPLISDKHPNITINFDAHQTITAITTAAKVTSARSDTNSMRSFKLNYRRSERSNIWLPWLDEHGKEIILYSTKELNGMKSNQISPSINDVISLSILPIKTSGRGSCFTLEVYGCSQGYGLYAYEIPRPNLKVGKKSNIFKDQFYDGRKLQLKFVNGVGELTDNLIGQFNDTGDSLLEKYQNRFVGWKKEEVKIVFRFDKFRRFRSVSVYSNRYEKNPTFSNLQIAFYLTGPDMKKGNSILILNHTLSDHVDSKLVYDVIKYDVCARFIEMTFRLPLGGVLLLSEVAFNSVETNPRRLVKQVETQVVQMSSKIPETNTFDNSLLIGCLSALVVVLIILILIFYLHRRPSIRSKIFRASDQNTSKHKSLLKTESSSTQMKQIDCEYATTLDESIYQEIDRSEEENVYLVPIDEVISDAVPSPGTVPPPLPTFPPPDHLPKKNIVEEILPYAEIGSKEDSQQSIQGMVGNALYAVPWDLKEQRLIDHSVDQIGTNWLDTRIKSLEFPRSKLSLVEKLGEGQFGEVHLCEAHQSLENISGNSDLSRDSKDRILVALKVLRDEVCDDIRKSFLKEVRIMSHLNHKHIVRLLAVCTKDQSFAMVTEYMEKGDLNQYLQQFESEIPASSKDGIDRSRYISNKRLINFAIQIASGMSYLSSIKFVHRDLATRNCLIGTKESLRIGDFGMSRNMYQSDYYRIQGRAVLPIRWMSWESLMLGKFSVWSDVWSFAVTLWEIFELCKLQPFENLSDQNVVDNFKEIYQKKSSNSPNVLQKPKRCSNLLYNLMLKCWSYQVDERPTFQDIHQFLVEGKWKNPKKPDKPPIPLPRKAPSC